MHSECLVVLQSIALFVCLAILIGVAFYDDFLIPLTHGANLRNISIWTYPRDLALVEHLGVLEIQGALIRKEWQPYVTRHMMRCGMQIDKAIEDGMTNEWLAHGDLVARTFGRVPQFRLDQFAKDVAMAMERSETNTWHTRYETWNPASVGNIAWIIHFEDDHQRRGWWIDTLIDFRFECCEGLCDH